MSNCQRCGEFFPDSFESGGKTFNFSKRKYCLTCRPFGASAPLPQFKKRETSECVVCSKPLSGRQEMFCSIECKTCAHSSYPKQKERGFVRKLELIRRAGGACAICGYNENTAAFHFHHLDPAKKRFLLDSRVISSKPWQLLLEEFENCILLCANCHAEHHNPDMVYEKLKRDFEGIEVY